MWDWAGDALGYVAAFIGGGGAIAIFDRRNTVTDRNADQQRQVIERVLEEMPLTKAVYGDYRARLQGGASDSAEQRAALDAARSKIEAASAAISAEELRDAVDAWLKAMALYASRDPATPAHVENALWAAALEQLGTALRT